MTTVDPQMTTADLDGGTDPWDYALFDTRPILTHVRDYARARMVGPWAVLGALLTEVIAATGPGYLLPPTVGGPASANLGLILAGPSGAGKGSAEKVAREAVTLATSPEGDLTVITTDREPIGSGEGVVATYRPAGTDPDAPNVVDRVIFTAQEIDILTALTSRSGATIDAVLRGLLMGETLGFANAGKDTRTRVAEHTYRACVILGAQPANAGPFLDGASGGLPQRFLWLPVADHHACRPVPAAPSPWRVVLPAAAHHGQHEVVIPDAATDAIESCRIRVLREDSTVDPLDGHRLLVQLKVAAALALLDGRLDLTVEDWKLADRIVAVSTYTRRVIVHALEGSRLAGELERERRREKVQDQLVQDRMAKAERKILDALERENVVNRAPLYRQARRYRNEFLAVCERLEHEGLLTQFEDDRGRVVLARGHRFTPGGTA